MQRVFSLLVDNNPGVLSRISVEGDTVLTALQQALPLIQGLQG